MENSSPQVWKRHRNEANIMEIARTPLPNTAAALALEAPLSVADFARLRGKTERTIRNWLKDGELPDATRNDRGVWAIPATAIRQPRSLDAELEAKAIEKAREEMTVTDILDRSPALLTVETASALLGISTYAVRKHATDLDGRPWGENGATLIPQATVRRLLGLRA